MQCSKIIEQRRIGRQAVLIWQSLTCKCTCRVKTAKSSGHIRSGRQSVGYYLLQNCNVTHSTQNRCRPYISAVCRPTVGLERCCLLASGQYINSASVRTISGRIRIYQAHIKPVIPSDICMSSLFHLTLLQ